MEEREWCQYSCFKENDKLYQKNQEFFLSFFTKGNNNSKLLDLGCKDGEFTKRISAAAGTGQVYGIEIDETAGKRAEEKGITVKKADLNNEFPFPDGTFDVISANQVLEHVWDTDNFFKEVNRVLRMGGHAVISVPNLSSLHSIFFILLGQQTPVIHLIDRQVGNFLRGVKVNLPAHFKAFNMPALKDLSKYYGFEVEKIGGFGFYFLPLLIQKLLAKLLGRYSIYITLRIRKIKDLE